MGLRSRFLRAIRWRGSIPADADVTGSLRERLFGGEGAFYANPYAGPVIDRTRKGDYGVAPRMIAASRSRATGSRSRPQGEVAPDDGQPAQGPALAQQQQPAPPPVQERQADVAAASPSEPAAPPQFAEPQPNPRRRALFARKRWRLSRRRPRVEAVRREIRLSHACPAARRRQGRRPGRWRRGEASEADVQSTGLAWRRPTSIRRCARRGSISARSHGTTARSDRAVGARRGTEIRNQRRDRDQRSQHEAGGAARRTLGLPASTTASSTRRSSAPAAALALRSGRRVQGRSRTADRRSRAKARSPAWTSGR